MEISPFIVAISFIRENSTRSNKLMIAAGRTDLTWLAHGHGHDRTSLLKSKEVRSATWTRLGGAEEPTEENEMKRKEVSVGSCGGEIWLYPRFSREPGHG
jgi:hypothetical protein